MYFVDDVRIECLGGTTNQGNQLSDRFRWDNLDTTNLRGVQTQAVWSCVDQSPTTA